MIKCKICYRNFKSITNTHLKKHNMTTKEYINLYGNDIFSEPQLSTFKDSVPWNKGRKGAQQAWNKHLCKVNHSFFKLHSSNMFYILGLWYSDGCIVMNRGSKKASLSLHVKDIKLIYDIASILKYEKKIYVCMDKRYENSGQVKLDIYSDEIYDDLNMFGCVERKSLIIRFPNIPTNYIKDFVRGYMDGNGSIFISRNTLHVTFTSGSRKFLGELRDQVNNEIGLVSSKTYSIKNRNVHFIRYAYKNRAETLLKWLYSDVGSLRLRRKYNVFNNYIKK